MKKILLAIALLAGTPAAMAEKEWNKEYTIVVVDEEGTGNFKYEKVVEVSSVSQKEMFDRAKQWIIANLKTNDNNIAFDEANMNITNTATVLMKSIGGITGGLINFKLNVQFKEGRYKFKFDNIITQTSFSSGIVETVNYQQLTKKNNAGCKYIRKEVNEKLSVIAQQLEAAIKNGSSKTSDNW